MEENNVQMENQNNERRKKLYLLGPLVLLVALGGLSYAFFNYTRTGSANVIKVGKLSFNANQTENINLVNVFPIDRANVDTDLTNVDEALITITGDTTYDDGIEYLVTATDFSNTVGSGANAKTIPISISVTASNGLGTEDANYFTNRGGNSSIYKVLSNNDLVSDEQILVGYITKGQTGVNGSLTIKAFLDKEKIGISDTYDGTESDSMGTTNEWANGRTILTTTEWNSLQTNGISFKIKVEASKGTWVYPLASEVIGALNTLETMPYGKIYTGSDPDNYVWFNNEQWRILGVYGDQLKIIRVEYFEQQERNGQYSTWNGSTLETYLNGTYYNSLSNEAKNMVADGTWDVGACYPFNINAAGVYTCAHATTLSNKKVGLITGYEYMYATYDEGDCFTVNASEYQCKNDNWLYHMLTDDGQINSWTINPYDGNKSWSAIYIYSEGQVYNNDYGDDVYESSPVVYLKSNVTITGGNGQIGETNSYKLGF